MYIPLFFAKQLPEPTRFFPDLEDCQAEGETLDDAIDNANEAAYNWIYVELTEDGEFSLHF